MKIANKISSSFSIIVMAITVIVSAFFYQHASTSLRNAIQQDLNHNAVLRADEIELYLRMLKAAIASTSKSVVLPKALGTAKEDPAYAEAIHNAAKLLKSKKEIDEAVYEYMLLDASGKIVASSDEASVGQDKSTDALFLGAQRGVYVKDVYNSQEKKQPLIAVSAPIIDSNAGSFLGVLAARIALDELYRIVGSKTAMGNTGEVFLINKYGCMITPSRFEKNTFLKKRISSENSSALLSHSGKPHGRGCKIIENAFLDYRGVSVLGTHELIPEMRWGLLAKIDVREALEPIYKLRTLVLIILLLTPLVAWLMGIVVAMSITKPLLRLQEGAEIIGNGNLDHKVAIPARDEVGQLSRAFDAMTESLKNKTTSIEKLDREVEERKLLEKVSLENALFLQKLMDSIPNPVFYKDISGIYIGCNKAYEMFFGLAQKEIIGKKAEDLFSLELANIYQRKDAELLALPGTQVYDVSVMNANGEPRSIVFHRATFTGPSGEVQGIIGVVEDITLHKRAEEKLVRLNLENELILSSVAEGILGLDLKGIQTFVNPAAAKMLGYEVDELLGRPSHLIWHHTKQGGSPYPQEECKILDACREGEVCHVSDELFWRKDGTSFPVEYMSTPIFEKGRLAGAVVTFLDITERKRAEQALLESDKRFMDVLYASKDAILLIDGDKFVDCNEAAARMLGYPPRQEFLMTHPSELSPPEQPDGQGSFEKANQMMKRAFEDGFNRFEWIHKKANGENFPVEVSLTPISIRGKNVLHCLWRDMTFQKQQEQEINESRQKFESIANGIPDAVLLLSKDLKILWANQVSLKTLGCSMEDVSGRHCYSVTHHLKSPCQAPHDPCPIEDIMKAGDHPATVIHKHFTKDGREFSAEVTIFPIKNEKGEILRYLHVSRDITEKKKFEEMLQQSEEKFRTLFQCSRDAIMLMEPPSWKFSSGNQAALEMFKVKNEKEFVSFGPWTFSPDRQSDGRASMEKIKEMNEIALRDGSHFFEWTHKRMGGEEFPATILLTRIEYGGKTVLQATARDISRERTYEQQLERDRTMLEEKSKELSAALKESLSAQEALSKTLAENIEVREKLEQSMTEVKKNQQMLLQSEKLASIGQLAAGIAHEINNPTGFIGSNISTLDNYMADITKIFRVMETLKTAIKEGDLEKARKIEKEVGELEKETDISYIFSDVDNLLRESKEGVVRIADIVRDLKMFSHAQEDVFIPSNLCKIIDGVINIVWSEIKYKAELKKDYTEDLSVACNPQQIGQVLINVLVNAAQAIKDKGVISIKTYEEDGFAHVKISDTGCGIPKENMTKIFDAFFTTKEPGKGTGLGLGISAAIMKKHGGTIKAESELGKGTTFTISLPLNIMKGV